MSIFYVCITTIRGYETALNTILESMPNEWKDKTIIVYQNESNERITVFENGCIEVCIKNNLHDYGNWIGVYKLLDKGMVPNNSCFLFVHDTCKFGPRTYQLSQHISNIFMNESQHDIFWLCNNGQCNISLLKVSAIRYGYNFYKDIYSLTKMQTVDWEWDYNNPYCPKTFNLKHFYIPIGTEKIGIKKVYSDVERTVLYYPSIDMEKYYVDIKQETDHPKSP
jgi:hypothetical protein